MRSLLPTTLLLLPTLTTAQSTSTISILALLGGPWSASILGTTSDTTTMQLVCPAPSPNPSSSLDPNASLDCGFAPTLTATIASTYFGASITDGGATGSVACTYTEEASEALCTQAYTSEEADATGETVIATLSGDSWPGVVDVTITGGLEQVAAQETGVSVTGMETGTVSGTRTSAQASQPTSSGAAATGFVRAGSVAGALGAVAVAAFAL